MNSIETKINMLYDFIYSKSGNNNIKPYNINVKDITLDDIKIKKSDSEDYINTLSELFNGKFKIINFDKYSKTIVLKRYSDMFSIALFITPYKSEKKIHKINSINNNDSLFSYILSRLVLNHKTPHIMLPIINIDIDFQQLMDIIKPYDTIYNDYMNMISNNTISKVFSIRTKEFFFKCMLLKEFVQTQTFDLKILLFQIIHTLAILQKEYPGFRHNILNLDNIYVYMKKESSNVTLYEYENTSFYITNNVFEIKITNFYGSVIPSLYTSDMKIPFIDDTTTNDYFDLYYFLNNLINTIDIVNKEDIEFLERVIPKKDRKHNNSMYMSKFIEVVTPRELLKSDYFKDYLKKKDMVELMSTNDYYNGNKRTLKKETMPDKVVSLPRKSMNGGSVHKKPSFSNVNSPFLSNENKRVYNLEKDNVREKTVKEPEDNVIASQEIAVNPLYKKPYNIKEKPSHFRDHVPLDKKHNVPQAKVSFDTRKINNEMSSEMYENKLYEKKPYENKPYENKPYEKKPYEKNSYENKYENKPYEKNSYEKNSYEKEDYYKQKRQPNITEAPLLAEQKLYQSSFTGTPGNTGHTHPKYSNPAFVSLDNSITYPPSFVPSSNAYFPFLPPPLKQNEIPLQQIYNINLGNPTVHNSTLNKIYEDMLPGDPYNFTMINLYERKQLILFMRNSILDKRDGELMTMQPGPQSIMEFVKILEFNPYRIGKHQYSFIAMDFLIYSGAYPVRYNTEKATIEVARYGLGLNIRIYKMSYGALYASQIGLLDDNFDVHRDIQYYDYIKTYIMDTKICPNFITMILYKIDNVSNINYSEMYSLIISHKQSTSGSKQQLLENIDMNKQINKVFTALPLAVKNNAITKLNLRVPIDFTQDSGKSMIVLTEAPTCNIIEWMCPTYNTNGAIEDMIATGFHTDNLWESILFQLVYSIGILQNKKIYIRNFNMENNIFIKDLFCDYNNIGHWIYSVGGINFYIPNYGSIVLIDTRYADVNPSTLVYNNLMKTNDLIFKITSPLYNVNGYDIPVSYSQAILRDFKNILDNNTFAMLASSATYKIIAPTGKTANLIQNIHDSREPIILNTLLECFPQYLHNRIGTFLTKSEVENINLSILPQFIIGSLMVYQERYNEYKWVLYLDKINDKKQLIYTKENNVWIKKQVFNYSLVYYPDANNLMQSSERSYKLSKESLIETYAI